MRLRHRLMQISSRSAGEPLSSQSGEADRLAAVLEIYKTSPDEYVKTVSDSEVHL